MLTPLHAGAPPLAAGGNETSSLHRAVEERGYPKGSYTAMVLGVLMLLTFFSLIDRLIPTFLVSPIRKTLSISDTEISLLQGSAFAIIFSLAGLPLGWLVDRGNRRNIIGVGAAVWSAATIYCGFAGSFWELFAGRLFVGIGEAALAPAVYSLIADYVEPKRRGPTIATYFLASSIGSGVALISIGFLISVGPGLGQSVPVLRPLEPWQIAFVLAGLPGLILLPALAAIREVPRRTNTGSIAPSTRSHKGLGEFSVHLRRNSRVFFCMYFALACLLFCNVAAYSWAPTFFMRKFDLPTAKIGLMLGLVIAIHGFLGTLTSILVSKRLAASRRRGGLQLLAVGAFALMIPCELLWPMVSSWKVSMMLYGLRCYAISTAYAAAPAIVQDIVPNQMRGKAIAIYMMMNGVAGYALGPTAVALVTDHVFHDDKALPYSLFLCLGPVAMMGLLASLSGLGAYDKLRTSLR